MKVAAVVARLMHDLIANLELIEEAQIIKRTVPHQGNGNNQHQLLTLDQVMELVPVSRATIHRMEKDGRFPAAKRLGSASRQHTGASRRVWRAREVYDWIEKDSIGLVQSRRSGKKKAAKKRAARKKK